MFFKKDKKNYIYFEELHIRHLNLLIDLKNSKDNNWFYKMAIINTFDDLKIFLKNLERNKYKCIIAIQDNKIISYSYTFPVNKKKTCLKINSPEIIDNNISISKRELILNLIKQSILNNDLKTSNLIISADINDNDLISSARELGFQPLQEIKLWRNSKKNGEDIFEVDYKNHIYESINKLNIQEFLNFIRSSESILIRNIFNFEKEDIFKRTDKYCGFLKKNNEIIFGIIKDITYQNQQVYSIVKGLLISEGIEDLIKFLIQDILFKTPSAIFKTSTNDAFINTLLKDIGLEEKSQELILVRNTLIRRDIKSFKTINNSIESILGKINPQGNIYPSPSPINNR